MSAISAAKVEALAKRGHVKCHGRGILGFRPVTHDVVLCTCVWRNLRRKGVNINSMADVAKFLAPDPPKPEPIETGDVPCQIPT
jgi:hypothetical protein